MVFKNLADAVNSIHILESANTSVCITDTDNNIIYESSMEDYKQDAFTYGFKKIDNMFYCSANATFKMLLIDDVVTTITTFPITISDESYLLEFKQSIKNISFSSEPHKFEDLSIHKIKEMAITDSLTKLYNRRYIDEQLPSDMQSSFERDEPLSILFIDIDHFKSVNDKNGHTAGDQVLREVGLILKTHLRRGSGWIARYGGDEILICLPGIEKRVAKRIANRLRKKIENHKFHYKGKEVTITCSIGVQTVFKDSGITNISELMALVDKNLYRAKKEGRNRVC